MDQEKFEEGLAVRRDVPGDDSVERSLANTDGFTRPMPEEIQEVLLQVAISRGMPAGVDGFRNAPKSYERRRVRASVASSLDGLSLFRSPGSLVKSGVNW